MARLRPLLRLVRALLIGVAAPIALAGCPVGPPLEPDPSLGADPSVPAPPGTARAGLVRSGAAGEAALFAGISAEGQAGDAKIYNEHVQFIVQAAGRRHGWVDVGGTLVDADRVRGPLEPGRDGLDDAFLAFGVSRLFEAETVTVVADGSDGGPAIVRTEGRDVPWDFFVRGLEAPDTALDDLGLAIVRDYELDPDATSIRVVTTFVNEGDATVEFRPAEGFQVAQEDFGAWFGDRGLIGGVGGDHAAVGWYGRQNEGVTSLWREEGTLRVSPASAVLAIASITLMNLDFIELPVGGSETVVVRYGLGPDTASVEAERRQFLGEDLSWIQGSVVDGDSGSGVGGARVHFVADTGQDEDEDPVVAGYAVTDRFGWYSTGLPPGDWLAVLTAQHGDERVVLPEGPGRYGPLAAASLNEVHLTALASDEPYLDRVRFAGGRAVAAPTAVTVSGDTPTQLNLTLPAAGAISLELEDGAGQPVPGTVLVTEASGSPPEAALSATWYEPLGLRSPSTRLAWAWTPTGAGVLPVPPGSYRLEAGHSWRHERAVIAQLDVTEGDVATASMTLTETVPGDDWVGVDTHLHAAPSMDGELPMEHRLVACAASGLPVAVMTDHDRFADYAPLSAALGLGERLLTVPGTEVTTIVRGHFNLFPVDVGARSRRNSGALVWWSEDTFRTDDLVQRVRAVGRDDSLLQVNHGSVTLGMMSAAGFDTGTGEPDDDSAWSWDFDTVEIVTADGRDEWLANRDDWFAMLSTGRLKVPTGASDSHDLGRACGLGRTDVLVPGAGANFGAVTVDAVRNGIADGHVVVASGVTLRASIRVDGVPGDGPELPPGSTLGAPQGSLQVTVRGPSWLVPGTLRVWRNGAVVFEQLIEAGDGSDDGLLAEVSVPVEHDDSLPAGADSWFVVEVDGGGPQGHAWGGFPPYAVTNAFLLDVDGDGWQPPGL